MFTDEQRNEFIEDGLNEEQIALLENTMALVETIDMMPKDVNSFIEEYKTKVPDDTINGMQAIAYAAEHDPKFFKELMALNLAMNYADREEPQTRNQKMLDNLSEEEYKRAEHNFYHTLANLSDKDKREFLNLLVNITPEQKDDMVERLKK